MDEITEFISRAEEEVAPQLAAADKIAEFNQLKVLKAMQNNRISEAHFAATNGYGYNDMGRDALEDVYAEIFKAEAALVRAQMVSGTHALAVALFGNLRPGDTLLSVTGAPYDTLHSVIGIRPAEGSLMDYGVKYKQVEFDYDAIGLALAEKPKMAAIQRSKGYAWRPSYTIAEIAELIAFIKNISPETIVMVDNCYGELVEQKEPVEVGADLTVGSLIKNPGGGLAPAGGYIVGGRKYVEAAASRLTAPGLGFEVGASLGLTAIIMQGLFLASAVVEASVRGAILGAAVFKKLGFPVLPEPLEPRTDIVQAVKLGTADKVLAFCRGIQKAAPVDSFVTPVAAPMPGYGHDVVMAAGAFVQGSSIELSADAPLKEPYIVYMQGGLTRYHAKIGVEYALRELVEAGLVEFIVN